MPRTNQNIPRGLLDSYTPSLGAAIVGAVAACIVLSLFLGRTIRAKAWLSVPMLIAVAMNTVGLICRVYSIEDPDNTAVFLVSYMTVILSPSIAAAACYITMKRLIFFVTPAAAMNKSTLWIPPRYITTIFVGLDITAFLIQFLGLVVLAGAANTDKSLQDQISIIQHGERILKLGLIAQLVGFGLFAIVGLRFVVRGRNWHTQNGTRWHSLAWAINGCATIITLRAIYRIIEFAGASSGKYIASHEWTYWVFDAYPMMIVFALNVLFHPGRYLPHEFLKLRYRMVRSIV